jgi:N-dimethylarginine dimethylaminohydrolase
MEGHVGSTNRAKAHRQWRALREAYASLGVTPNAVMAAEGLPDMVFCANQTLPYYDPHDGERGVVLSRMAAPERRDEVPHYEQYFRQIGYAVVTLPEDVGHFEGMGDAIWHPGRHLLWGGYGFRTDRAAYDAIAQRLDVTVLGLHLDDPDFYHLDTCLSPLDQTTVLFVPSAFDQDGLDLIDFAFDTLIEVPDDEARDLLAGNAHCPDGTHVLIQEGCTETNRRLRSAGFEPVELATDEFLKAGGSVFCMKLMYW